MNIGRQDVSRYIYFNDRSFARHPYLSGEPCYRLIMCHALFRYFLSNEKSQEILEEALQGLNRCYTKSGNSIYFLKDYLELYKLTFSDENDGYVLVDQTGGIFPLIFYPYPNSLFFGSEAKERAKAFRAAIDDVAYKKSSDIIRLFNAHETWSELEPELKKIFEDSYQKSLAA